MQLVNNHAMNGFECRSVNDARRHHLNDLDVRTFVRVRDPC